MTDLYFARRAVRKAVDAVADHWRTATQDVSGVLSRAEILPQNIDFETTNICNANCIFCAYQYQLRPTGVMPLDLYDRLIREVASLGIRRVGFTPMVGDPLVDPHILNRLASARSLGIPSISFFTNGILLDKIGVDDLLRSGITDINISTAGFDEQSYQRVYRSARYHQMYGGLLKLLERNRVIGQPVKIYIAIRADEPLSVIRRKADFRRIENLIDGVEANIRFDSWSGRIAPTDLLPGMSLRRASHKEAPCSMLYFGLTVLWDGQVTACGCRDLDAGSDLVLGNAMNASLLEMWNSAVLADIRRRWVSARELPGICRDCTHYTPATRYLRPELREGVELAANTGVAQGLGRGADPREE